MFMIALGWTLVHFIWQGALIGAVVAAALRVLRPRDAAARYAVCCGGLAVMVLAPPVTMIVMLATRTEAMPLAADILLPDGPASAVQMVLPQLTGAWIIGVLLLQTRLLVRWFRAQLLRRHGIRSAPAPCRRMVAELCEQLAIRPIVAVAESTIAQVPMVIGWLRPLIVIPVGMVTGLTAQQLRAILAHELAHVRRHDYLVNLIQSVLETLLFYHPAVWWLSNTLRVEREYCCDDVAVRLGGNALRYARTLSLLETLRGDDPQLALASTGGTLMTRIQRLLGAQTGAPTRSAGWMTPVGMTIAVVAACTALTLARPADEKEHPGPDHDVAHFGPTDDVDLVALLQKIDAREAAFFAVLRDAGLDDETMMMILERLGPDERVRKALAKADRHEVHELHEVHEHLEREVTAGRMSKEHATRKFHTVLRKVEGKLPPRMVDEARREMAAVKERLTEQVEAGLMTEAEAKRALYQAHEELKTRLMQRHERHVHPEAIDRLHALHDAVKADLEAGRISKQEAEQRIHAAADKLHRHMAAVGVKKRTVRED